jgi:hypothetical protein
MPDIAMCDGKDCPMKDQCYRFRAIPHEIRQYYFALAPIRDGKCDEFLKINETDQLNFNKPISVIV